VPVVTTVAPQKSGSGYLTIADYIKDHDIEETQLHGPTPGAPTVELPVPQGWSRTSSNFYAGVTAGGPDAEDYGPYAALLLSRINGDFDSQEFINLAPGELYNLNSYQPVFDEGIGSLDGYKTYELGGTFIKDGRHLFIVQQTIVIPGRDGFYVAQVNSMGPDNIRDTLSKDIELINTQLTIHT
jgi:hypothetical protein